MEGCEPIVVTNYVPADVGVRPANMPVGLFNMGVVSDVALSIARQLVSRGAVSVEASKPNDNGMVTLTFTVGGIL